MADKVCFVACAIGDEGSSERRRTDNIVRLLIRPVLEPRGYRVVPAHEDARPGVITSHIVERLVKSELVVADITGPNPNVMYEVAIRNAARKPVVLLCEKGQKIPFDLDHNRVVELDYEHWDGPERARPEFEKHVNSAEEDPEGASASPVTEAILTAMLFSPPAGGSSDDRIGELAKVVMDLREHVRAGLPRAEDVHGTPASTLYPERVKQIQDMARDVARKAPGKTGARHMLLQRLDRYAAERGFPAKDKSTALVIANRTFRDEWNRLHPDDTITRLTLAADEDAPAS